MSGRPTFCILISEENMRDPQFNVMLDLLAQIRDGVCDGVKVGLEMVVEQWMCSISKTDIFPRSLGPSPRTPTHLLCKVRGLVVVVARTNFPDCSNLAIFVKTLQNNFNF